MATFVNQTSAYDYGGDTFNVTLNGGGTDRLVVALVAGRAGGSATMTSATLGGNAGTVIANWEAVNSAVLSIALVAFPDTSHPGAGATTLNCTWSTGRANSAAMVWELSGAPQAAPFFDENIILSNVPVVSGTTYSDTVNLAQGALVLPFFVMGSNSTDTFTITPSANIDGSLFETTNDLSQIWGGYDTAAATNAEQYDMLYTHTANTPTNQFAYGTIAFITPSSLVVDTEPTATTRGGTESVTVSGPATAPTTGNTTLTMGGQSLTVDSVTGTGPYVINFTVPSAIALQHGSYPIAINIAGEQVSTGSIPFNPPTGWTYLNIADPNQCDLVGDDSVYQGDTVLGLTGAQYVHETTTTPDNIPIDLISAEGYVTLASAPTVNQTFDGYKISSDGTVNPTYAFTVVVEDVDTSPIITFPTTYNAELSTPTLVIGTVTDVDAGTTLTLEAGSGDLSNNNGINWSSSVTYVAGQTLARTVVVSSASYSTPAQGSVTVNGVVGTATVITKADPNAVAGVKLPIKPPTGIRKQQGIQHGIK